MVRLQLMEIMGRQMHYKPSELADARSHIARTGERVVKDAQGYVPPERDLPGHVVRAMTDGDLDLAVSLKRGMNNKPPAEFKVRVHDAYMAGIEDVLGLIDNKPPRAALSAWQMNRLRQHAQDCGIANTETATFQELYDGLKEAVAQWRATNPTTPTIRKRTI